MNIHELDSYDLGDAVKFNDQLNPRLWSADEKMRPEVREQLLKIADDFREFLGIDVGVKDITVSGSNAAYTYTPHSDIDLHLVVDLPKADESEVYRELFDAKKYAYNDQHRIRIGDYDVELYVQDANKPHHSQGIYSLVNDDWVSVPKRRRPHVDDISVRSKFEDLGHRIEAAIKSQDYEKISELTTKLKDYRQAGLDAHGEFGPENLAFKILRTQGLIKRLYDARTAAKDRLLSLDERRKKKKKKKVRYGYGGYWYPGTAYAGQDHPAGSEGGGGDGGGESMREDVGMTWDGVSDSTDMFTSEDAGMTWDGVNPSTAMFTTETENKSDEEILRDFIKFCVAELKIDHMPRVRLRRDPAWPGRNKTFGRYNDDAKTLEVAWGNRHIMDVLRTVAHELTHKRQHERENVPASAGETGSEYENEANARAGILMRDWGRLHPEYFDAGQATDLEESWKFSPCTLSSVELSAVLQKSYRTIFEQTGNRWYPHRCSQLAQFVINSQKNLLKENAQLADLFKFQKSLRGIDRRNSINLQPGKPIAVVQVIPHTADSVIELNGFKIPKKIKNIFTENNGDIKYIEFNDGSTYPDQHFISAGKGGGELEGTNTLFFSTQQEADQAVTMIGYKIPEGWQLSTVNINETQFNESASGYIPTKAQARDPRYSMALTQDIRPGQVGREANKLKLRTDRQGHPQIARANGLFETLMAEYQRLKKNEPALDEADLDEVKMSPGALEKFAKSDEAKGIRAGFEAELIFRDTQGEAEELDPEPNYDADERAYSISQVIEFFANDEYGFGMSERQQNRLEEELNEKYYEWYDEQMIADFSNDAEDLIRELLLDETPMAERIAFYLTDSLNMSDEDAAAVIAAGAKAPRFTRSEDQEAYAAENPEYETYLEAADAAELELDESVEQSVRSRDEYWDAALDDFRDNYSGDDSGFFSDVGLRWMSDIASEFDLGWPIWDMDAGRNEGSRDWEEIGNSLQDVVGMPVVVSSNYHSTARRPGQWIIEPDGSLDPDDKGEEAGLEIVSPPMPLLTAIEKLKAVVDWANDPRGGNAYTNRSTGLHMGVSLPTMAAEDVPNDPGIDYVKLILFLGDKYVQQQFGREANTYCASALDKLQQNIRGGKSDPAGVVKLLQHGLTELAYKELQKGVGTSKYTSAHIQPGYVEFRSPGGDWLAKSDEEIGILENTMMRFARAMQIAGDPNAERQEYAKKLYKLVTADNPEYADQLRLFSEYSAGTIDKEQLKKQWAEQTLQKDVPAVADAPSAEPEPTLTPRAKLAKRIAQPKSAPGALQNYEVVDRRDANLRVVGRFQAQSEQDAPKKYSLWLKTNNLPNDTDAYGYRKTAAKPAQPAGVQDVDLNVAQNFAAGRENYELVQHDDPNRIIHRMPYATADEVRAWIAQQEREGMPAGFLRVRIPESINPISGAGAVAPRPVVKKISTDRVEPVKPVIRSQKSRSAIGQAISQQDIENMTQQIQMARQLGDDVTENFADGRVKGKSRPGRVKRAGASCKGSVTDLRARAKKYGGEKGRMYHWCANMKSGRKK